MATIVTRTSRLSVIDKCQRGKIIIEMSTNNPLVPGNEVPLAAFAQVQDELYAAELAVEGARTTLAALVVKRDAIEKRWNQSIGQLAGFTEFATGGDVRGMLSAGFGVREPGAPAQVPDAPIHVSAATNGTPGRTKLSWEPIDGVILYFVQMCAAPLTADGWQDMPGTTRSSCEVDGAEPGKVTWFRVAGVNTAGQGPWSQPACRQVM